MAPAVLGFHRGGSSDMILALESIKTGTRKRTGLGSALMDLVLLPMEMVILGSLSVKA